MQSFKVSRVRLGCKILTSDISLLKRAQNKRNNLQLVGVTAMLIASKYEEIYAPEIRDFVYITDNAYTK